MALLPNRNHKLRLMVLSFWLYSSWGPGTIVPTAIAHNVEVAADVAATMHLEPNHHPKAGEPALVWFALTRQGGELIPLEQCNCRLAIYPEPRSATTKSVLQPALKPISVERYQGIPGVEVVFPQSGIYLMVFSGSPQAEAQFQPFELTYPVTVTAGSPRPVAQVPAAKPTTGATTNGSGQVTPPALLSWQGGLIASAAALGLGVAAIVINRQKRK